MVPTPSKYVTDGGYDPYHSRFRLFNATVGYSSVRCLKKCLKCYFSCSSELLKLEDYCEKKFMSERS